MTIVALLFLALAVGGVLASVFQLLSMATTGAVRSATSTIDRDGRPVAFAFTFVLMLFGLAASAWPVWFAVQLFPRGSR